MAPHDYAYLSTRRLDHGWRVTLFDNDTSKQIAQYEHQTLGGILRDLLSSGWEPLSALPRTFVRRGWRQPEQVFQVWLNNAAGQRVVHYVAAADHRESYRKAERIANAVEADGPWSAIMGRDGVVFKPADEISQGAASSHWSGGASVASAADAMFVG